VRNRILYIFGGVILFLAGYLVGNHRVNVAYGQATPTHGGIPKAYGHLVTAVVNDRGTGLVFEDSDGTIRLTTLTGQVESELTRK
jgi:hypothetical protein